ncbi:MAG: hypothetical protein FJ335_03770, partial [Sphingomonadales bacterium]|nr:hypothetical protein [Sphingomonadales bacterium]
MVDRIIKSDRTIILTGPELVAGFVARATAGADEAEDARDDAQAAAATALATGRYFPTKAAGEAGSTTGQAFTTKDGAGNLIAYERTAGGSTEIGRAVTPAALAAPDGAGRVGVLAV